MSKDNRVSVGVGAVALRGDRVLLIRMNRGGNRGQWAIPGGYLEPGESLEETVIREVAEETGLTFHPDGIIAIRSGVRDRPEGEETNLYVAFVGTCGDGEPVADNNEVTEVMFLQAERAVQADDVAGLTRHILAAALANRNRMQSSPDAVDTRNRYRSYDLYI